MPAFLFVTDFACCLTRFVPTNLFDKNLARAAGAI